MCLAIGGWGPPGLRARGRDKKEENENETEVKGEIACSWFSFGKRAVCVCGVVLSFSFGGVLPLAFCELPA